MRKMHSYQMDTAMVAPGTEYLEKKTEAIMDKILSHFVYRLSLN